MLSEHCCTTLDGMGLNLVTYWGQMGEITEHLDGILMCCASLCEGPSQEISCGRKDF